MEHSFTSTGAWSVTRPSSSSWTSGRAQQGQYSQSNRDYRVGVLQFNGLKSYTDWSAVTVTEITLTLTFTAGGYDSVKKIGFYAGKRDSVSSSVKGSDIRGSALGEMSTSPVHAYDETGTFTLSENSNATLFRNLCAFIQGMTANTLVTYYPDTWSSSSAEYTRNYLGISSAVMTIAYTENGDSGYIGVNGKARKVTAKYIGVNGKARKVVGGWIGVGGKARRIL